MNNDIRPQRPTQAESTEPSQTYPLPTPTVTPPISPGQKPYDPLQPQNDLPTVDLEELPRPKKRWWWQFVNWFKFTLILVLMLMVAAIALTGWAVTQLEPVAADSDQKIAFTVAEGTGTADLANSLGAEGLIKNPLVFEWYVRVTGAAADLKAGSYQLSPSSDAAAIIKTLTTGITESFTITFVPGKTLADYTKPLQDVGFSKSEIEAAFMADYEGKLFDGRPAGSDIEGYIYPETYQFAKNATISEVLEYTFREFERVIDENDLVAAYQKQGLSLREGIILASIIEREAANTEEMAQISQVFHLRLDRPMPLGSDPTYQYIADKTGVPRDTKLDSPYNTRIVTGLTPGPIASPSEAALIAAAEPASGDYVYFVHGDDGKIRYARTNAEHEENVAKYCIELCKLL